MMMKYILIIVIIFLWSCVPDSEVIGTYYVKYKVGSELLNLHDDGTFIQSYTNTEGVKTNKGKWHTESKLFMDKRIIFDQWACYYDPFEKNDFQPDTIKTYISTFIVEPGIIRIYPDFPEYDYKKQKPVDLPR